MIIRGFLLLAIIFQLIFFEAEGTSDEDSPCPRYGMANDWISLTGRWQIKQTIFHLPTTDGKTGKSEQYICETVDIQNEQPGSIIIKWWQLYHNIYYKGELDDAKDVYLWKVTGPYNDSSYSSQWPHPDTISPHPMRLDKGNVKYEGLIHVYRTPKDENNIMLIVCLRNLERKKKVKSFTQLLTKEERCKTSIDPESKWDNQNDVDFINTQFLDKYQLNKFYTIKTCSR